MDRLKRSMALPFADYVSISERLEFATEQQFSRVTVSVVLGNERQIGRWAHSLAKLGLLATECERIGDLVSFSVRGHRYCLNTLVSYKSIVAVEWLEAALPSFRVTDGPKPPVPHDIRAKKASEQRKIASVAADKPLPS